MLFSSAYSGFYRTLLALACLLGSAIASNAQSEKTIIERCGDLHTQAEMNDCAAREARKADVELNATYQELLSKIRENKTAREKVVAAEKAWIVFRDAQLAAEWPVADGENPNVLYGSVHPFCYSIELATMTWDRVKTLKSLMQHEEGDVCGSGLAENKQVDGAATCNSNLPKANVHGRRRGGLHPKSETNCNLTVCSEWRNCKWVKSM